MGLLNRIRMMFMPDRRLMAEACAAQFEKGLALIPDKPMSPEEYNDMRRREEEWLEAHYDFNTIEGVNAIPVSRNLPRPPFGGVTGDVDYYIRHKSAAHEKAGNIELAILCLKKSNDIRALTRRGYRKDDYLRLVRLLAASGRIEEAKAEKQKIDKLFGDCTVDAMIGHKGMAINPMTEEDRQKTAYYEEHMIEIAAERGRTQRAYEALQIALPNVCPKSLSGFRRMKTQNTKNFQRLKLLAEEKGIEL